MSSKTRLLEINAMLAQILINKGVNATADETTTQLVNKVSEIKLNDGYYDDAWDSVQEKGNRTDYSNTFSRSWTDALFKPKYDIIPIGSVVGMFTSTKITNLAKIIKDCNIIFDTSKVTNFQQWVQGSAITYLPCISLLGLPTGGNTANIFYGASNLVSIEKLIIRKDIVWSTAAFGGTGNLEEIHEIDGEIGTKISLSGCSKLSNATVDRIINALADLTGSTTQTLSVAANIFDNILSNENQLNLIFNKNWNLE